jgi:glutaredoxin
MKRRLLPLLLPLSLVLPSAALAQYKVVDAEGRVTYTDRPTPAISGTRVTEMRRPSLAAPDPGLAGLPFELRQVVQRYPVVLFTANDCPPCDSGRQLLVQRGVPHSERRLVTEADMQTAERTLGWRTVPSLSIGTQPLRGFTADEWGAFLDAAGYPRESKLPRGWTGAAPAASAAAAAGDASRTRPAVATP